MTNNDLYDAIISVKDATQQFSRRTVADFRAVNGRLDRVETQLRRLETRIESLEDGQKSIRADLSELKHRSR